MSDHALWSPSSADRHMVCTASIPLIQALLKAGELKDSDLDGDKTERISEDEVFELEGSAYQDVVLEASNDSNSFTSEGTVMHTVRELCLLNSLDPEDFIGLTMKADGFSFIIDDAMADRLVEGIDWIREHTETPLIEVRVDLSDWWPGQFGTCDTGFVSKKILYVSDYKNGVGMPVAAEFNRQLRIYALGIWAKLGRPAVKSVVINIDQPRAGGMKFWEISLSELLEFGEEMKRVYKRVADGDVEFVPTKKGCQWCPVRKTSRGCAAYNKFHIQLLGLGVIDPNEPPSFVNPDQMPRALRFYITSHAASIKKWLTELHEQSLAAAIRGEPDPGSKAIEGSEGNRYFTDPLEAELLLTASLGSKAYVPKKLIGFTEIDKLLKPGRKKIGDPETYDSLALITNRPEGKPKLVPADHPKPEYNRWSVNDFDDVDDHTDAAKKSIVDLFDDVE